jgi:PiT family inorganic phosphate transporter
VALVFDFVNGFHDAANSIATVVSTRVLSPALRRAVGGVLQLRRVPVFSTHVATTIGTGVVRPR